MCILDFNHKVFHNLGHDVTMKIQLTQLENNFVFVELQDGVFSYQYNVDYDIFEKAGSGVPIFQSEKVTKFKYKGMSKCTNDLVTQYCF